MTKYSNTGDWNDAPEWANYRITIGSGYIWSDNMPAYIAEDRPPEVHVCPFCSSCVTTRQNLQKTSFHVTCQSCGARGPARVTRNSAIAEWNKRV
jgi:Lar family restriction alleviation protein